MKVKSKLSEKAFYEEVKLAFARNMNLKEGEVIINKVVKQNDQTLYGLAVNLGEGVSPQFYLNDFYDYYLGGIPVESIAQFISDKFEEILNNMPFVPDINFEYEKVKDRLCFQLLDKERNIKRLENAIYEDLGNGLVLTYSISCSADDNGGIFTTAVTKDLASEYGYDIEQLKLDALESTAKKFPPTFNDAESMLKRKFKKDMKAKKGKEMYILRSSNYYHGSAALYYPGVMETIGEFFEMDYYVIPSSIEEVIIVPINSERTGYELKTLLVDSNITCIEENEVLSNTLYKYEFDSKRLVEWA